MKPRKTKRRFTSAVSYLMLMLLIVYTASLYGAGEYLQSYWKSWADEKSPGDIYEPPVPPSNQGPVEPSPEPEPVPKPIPEPEPEPTPEPEPEPPAQPDPGGNEPDDPVIYAGQKLTIPLALTTYSQVIKQGILSRSEKQIALTFDAGWLYEQTVPLLDILDRHGVKATFFTRALWVQSHPDLARQIVTRGHALENHSLTHGHLTTFTDRQLREEIRESTRIIRETTGYTPYLFRPPYGEYNDRMLAVLAEEGYPYTIMWTLDTHDWAEEISGVPVTADYLVSRVLTNTSPNGIILMHVGGYKTVEALPRILTGLQEQGYQFATVNKMVPDPAQLVRSHTVQAGETLYSISRQYGISVEQIILANGL